LPYGIAQQFGHLSGCVGENSKIEDSRQIHKSALQYYICWVALLKCDEPTLPQVPYTHKVKSAQQVGPDSTLQSDCDILQP